MNSKIRTNMFYNKNFKLNSKQMAKNYQTIQNLNLSLENQKKSRSPTK